MSPWAPVLGAGIAAAAGLCAYGVFDPNAPLFGPVIGRGASAAVAGGAGGGVPIYLTFDDGPNPTATERILDVLGSEGAPAAFFQVGRHVARYAAIARRASSSSDASIHGTGSTRCSRRCRGFFGIIPTPSSSSWARARWGRTTGGSRAASTAP